MTKTAPHAKHADYDKQIKSHSDKAFEMADANPAMSDEAKASHDRLFSWLTNIHANSMKPESFVTDGMVELVVNEFNKDPVEDLPGKVRRALEKLFAATFKTGATLSRQNGDRPWEQTGFFSDPKDAGAVFAKVGKDVYQPIGFDDGQRYLPIEVSKLLWARDWALAFIVPIPPAFRVEAAAPSKAPATEGAMNPLLLEVIKVCHTDIAEELDGYMKARSGTDEEKKEADYRLRETIKLCRIRFKELDDKMDMVYQDRPELGKNLENSNIGEVAHACLEYLAMVIDSATVRGKIDETTLVIPKADEKSLPMLATIKLQMKKELAKDNPDGDYLGSLITGACNSHPPLRLKLDEFKGKDIHIVEAARILVETINDSTT